MLNKFNKNLSIRDIVKKSIWQKQREEERRISEVNAHREAEQARERDRQEKIRLERLKLDEELETKRILEELENNKKLARIENEKKIDEYIASLEQD